MIEVLEIKDRPRLHCEDAFSSREVCFSSERRPPRSSAQRRVCPEVVGGFAAIFFAQASTRGQRSGRTQRVAPAAEGRRSVRSWVQPAPTALSSRTQVAHGGTSKQSSRLALRLSLFTAPQTTRPPLRAIAARAPVQYTRRERKPNAV